MFPVLCKLRDEQDGSIAVMSALFMTVCMGVSALAIDFGLLYLDRRTAQGAVDLAAIAAAGQIDNARARAEDVLAANGFGHADEVGVVLGSYSAAPEVSPGQRFRPGAEPFNAVRVTMAFKGRSYFGRVLGGPEPTIDVAGIAASADAASFSVGSRLLAVRGGIANSILSALLGGSIELSVMDYEALAQARVEVGPLLDRLVGDLDLTAVTYDEVLQSELPLSAVIEAASAVANIPEVTGALAIVAGGARSGGHTVKLSDIFDLGPLARAEIGSQMPGTGAVVDLATLVQGGVIAANGSQQVSIDLAAGIPGVSKVTLKVGIGERPVRSPAAYGMAGSIVRTAQLRLALEASLAALPGYSGTEVTLPIAVEAAFAEARLGSISCSADRQVDRVDVLARPGVLEAWIGSVRPGSLTAFGHVLDVDPAHIVKSPLANVFGSAHASVSNSHPTSLRFTARDIEDGHVLRTETNEFVASIVSSLIGDLDLDVSLGGVSLGLPGALRGAVAASLSNVARPLDGLVHQVLQALGLHLGEADVRVLGARCGAGVLAG